MSIIKNLEQMLVKGRDDAMLRFGLGSALFNEARFAEAITHLEACLAHDRQYSAAYKLLGKAYLKQGDVAGAIRVFNEGLPVAVDKGDKQSMKEMQVFLAKAMKESNHD